MLFRNEIREYIEKGSMRELSEAAGRFHGHICPFLVLGSMVGAKAVKMIETQSTGFEEVIALIETNSCFSDGIQYVTGCTIGNNGLIYLDFGKIAVTVCDRSGIGFRFSLLGDARERLMSIDEEVWGKRKLLFEKDPDKISSEEMEKIKNDWIKMSFEITKTNIEEYFSIKEQKAEVPPYAPRVASVTCSVCEEQCMETKARIVNEKTVCLRCSGVEYDMLDGSGIRKHCPS